MCYSILVQTDLAKLAAEFGATIDIDAFLQIYRDRSKGIPNLQIPRGLDASFSVMDAKGAKQICKLVEKHDKLQIQKLEEKLKEKIQLTSDLQEKLKKKWFKTNQEKLETAQRVLDATGQRIKNLSSPHSHGTPLDSRIMQYSYAPLIVKNGTKKLIRPFRYQVRAHGTKSEPDRKINLYNVRCETIAARSTWRPLFMKNHAIISYLGFYEWVPGPKNAKPAEIFFFPNAGKKMWSPVLYDNWTNESQDSEINSFAIITMPPPEFILGMGHDRCPIHPNQSFINDWLNPKSCNRDYIHRNLLMPETIDFDYKWVVS